LSASVALVEKPIGKQSHLADNFSDAESISTIAMPALVAVAALAILLAIFPSVALATMIMWAFWTQPLVHSLCHALGGCSQPGYDPVWTLWIGFLPVFFPAFFCGWKWRFGAERRRLYLNLFVLTAGIPVAIVTGWVTFLIRYPN
jgi:hypothetical protein